MRSAWTDFVKKVQKQESRKKKEKIGWRESLKIASTKWPAEKEKVIRKLKREKRKREREGISVKKKQEREGLNSDIQQKKNDE